MRGCHWNTLQYITVSLGGRRGARSLAPTHTHSEPPTTPPGCLSGRCQHVTMSADTNDGAERRRLIFHIFDTPSNSSNSAAKALADRSFVSCSLTSAHTKQAETHLSELQTDATAALLDAGWESVGGTWELRQECDRFQVSELQCESAGVRDRDAEAGTVSGCL